MTLGQWLKRERERAGLNLKQLSEKSGISPSYLSAIERDSKHPSTETLVKLGRTFNTPELNIIFQVKNIKKIIYNYLSHYEVSTIYEVCKTLNIDISTYLIECILTQTQKDANEYGVFEENPWLIDDGNRIQKLEN